MAEEKPRNGSKEYVVVSDGCEHDFIQLVNAHLREGWEPFGGVSVTSHFESWENSRKGYTETETFVMYAQAMVREVTP